MTDHTRSRSPSRRAQRVLLIPCLLAGLAACQDAAPPDPKLGILTSTTDSVSTAAEIHASLMGEKSPGGEAYSYRGLYAGLTQTRIDSILAATRTTHDSVTCAPAPKPPESQLCSQSAVLGIDHAPVRVATLYGPAAKGVRTAREVTIVRQLPLDVDGVRVAGALADAFEQQTTLLDTRDASYGRHQAHIRMGTVNGARANFAEVTVASHSGREELTVRLGRGAR
jgi:hypothetical protein